jgi:hypothetical protein
VGQAAAAESSSDPVQPAAGRALALPCGSALLPFGSLLFVWMVIRKR